MQTADRIDARLLRTQIISELEKWEVEVPHKNSLVFYEETLPDRIISWMNPQEFEVLKGECRAVAVQIRSLADHVQNNIVPNLTLSDSQILGREKFARQLEIYTDSPLTPEELEGMALDEIQKVRQEMALASEAYLREAYPNENLPETYETLVGKALYDMESNHPSGNVEYLKLLRSVAQEAEDFVREKKIATIPEHQTLSIEIAPESSGASARIGYVSPPPAFSPNPWTTWYLATIPDSFPEDEKEDFWRSFNNHFKKFIVIHELFPGHYIQRKLTRENPHPVRILFSYRPYSEGFATLCERIALEAGWDNFNKLTKLAQLRKKLENANRAYPYR